MKSLSLFVALALAAASPGVHAAAAGDWQNPGFENGTNGWSIRGKKPMGSVNAEAAHSGAAGLHVDDQGGEGAHVRSGKLSVLPGQEVRATFWARTTNPKLAGVYLWFSSPEGKLVKVPDAKGGQGFPLQGVNQADGDWHQYSLKGTVPEEASTVSLWIHTYGTPIGTVDFDDFILTVDGEQAVPKADAEPKAETASEVKAAAPEAKAAPKSKAAPEAKAKPEAPVKKAAAASSAAASATPAAAPVKIPPRANPPIIVLKLDDLKQHYGGRVHPRWDKVAAYLEEKKIKAGFGIICKTLEKADPKYVDWIRTRRENGIEFWFHAWDHAVHEVDGVKYNEFNMRPYEEQKERLAHSQELAREKLGFSFHAFGPPGGVGSASFNEDTLRVMVADPEMHVMLYPAPLTGKSALTTFARQIMADSHGKFVILDVLWQVRLERPLFKPNFDAFVKGYAKYPNRQYFVLQGHPAAWTDASFEQFKQIVEFLITQKAVFMTPSEAARAVYGEAPAAASQATPQSTPKASR